ncbi:GNAT family N-acetyltransferase [Rhodocytophaga rosea]|uniref:GNAT family N-acetyltransferase n=1 Tax=Rhodocytophaga rosea TaxID=2704465 RepID=A0A6C0GSN3_9BACT|nr:GNAT family N-acetyltransferase [Rhodocytophaga rosea]QHT71138.1 GNAT family N-acetyltransferase [Rhodocytophaga rosea]
MLLPSFYITTLKNNSQVRIRLLQWEDEEKLLAYFASFSPETRNRFGPHPFDASTVHQICTNLEQDDIQRYIAETLDGKQIVAYMLMKHGTLEKDAERMHTYGLDTLGNAFTFAPSIADSYQSSGLGSIMLTYILASLPARKIILWGGVQASNQRAVSYYTKFGFHKVGTFEYHNGTNYDMIREPT